MCDGCGCDKQKNGALGGTKVRYLRQKVDGWHIHADGTVHRHAHAHDQQAAALLSPNLLKPLPLQPDGDQGA